MDRVCLFERNGGMFYEFKHIGTSDYFIKEYGENFSFQKDKLCPLIIRLFARNVKIYAL